MDITVVSCGSSVKPMTHVWELRNGNIFSTLKGTNAIPNGVAINNGNIFHVKRKKPN